MRNSIFIAFVLLLSLTGIHFTGMGQTTSGNNKPEYLTGEVSLQKLKEDSLFSQYYRSGFHDYEVAGANQIKTVLSGVKITVVLGTWCHDSQVQVPRFFKILTKARYLKDNVKVLCVNMDKKIPGRNISELNIKRVPTFIFYKDEKEIGRIIESPKQSLEEDMLSILR